MSMIDVNNLLVQNWSGSEGSTDEGRATPIPLFCVNTPLVSCPFFLEYTVLQILVLVEGH